MHTLTEYAEFYLSLIENRMNFDPLVKIASYREKISKLQLMLDNFGNVEKLYAHFSKGAIDNQGVCLTIGFSQYEQESLANSFPTAFVHPNGRISTAYPVGGAGEYCWGPADKWSNPNRKKYIEHSIEFLEKVIEIIEAKNV